MSKFDFNPKATSFSFKNALALAEVSELAYSEPDSYKKILLKEKGSTSFFQKRNKSGRLNTGKISQDSNSSTFFRGDSDIIRAYKLCAH